LRSKIPKGATLFKGLQKKKILGFICRVNTKNKFRKFVQACANTTYLDLDLADRVARGPTNPTR